MDLTIFCLHCKADKGHFCNDTCPVNGDKIIKLKKALSAIGFRYDENVLKYLSNKIIWD